MLAGAGTWNGRFATPGGVHRSFEVSVVLDGTGPIVANGYEVVVEPGDVLACDMNLPHRHLLPGLRLRYVNFEITNPSARDRMRKLIAAMPTPLLRLPGTGGSIGSLFEDLDRLEREHRWNRPLGSLMAKSAFLSVLVRLLRGIDDSGGDASLAERVSAFLEANLGARIRLADLGARFSLSPRYLNTVFKRHTGTTIGRHLVDLRIDHVRRLLTRTDSSITEIALDAGFSDCQHLCKVFKEHVGCTPTEFRRGLDVIHDGE